MTEEKKGNLADKLAWVMSQVGWIQKTGRNEKQGYKYATDADVSDVVREKLAEAGVAVIPYVQSVSFREIQGQNKAIPVATVIMDFTFVCGEEKQTVRTVGEGMDPGDKAVYKAMTGATKYALLKTFLLPTGDDPERDDVDEKPQNRPPPPEKPPSPPSGTPQCPKCGGEMAFKEGEKNGKHYAFWGCKNYPKCDGTRKFSKQEPKKEPKKNVNREVINETLGTLGLQFSKGMFDKWFQMNFGAEIDIVSIAFLKDAIGKIKEMVKKSGADVFQQDVEKTEGELF